MISVRGTAVRLGLFAAAMLVVLVLVLTAIQRPVDGATEHHKGLFTDASGMKVGDDVRMYGVQVGEIEAVELDGALARVRFSARIDHPVYTNSTLAIRYQNLTGQRYLDIQQPPQPADRLAAGATLGTDHTVPSFDVTSLFNGLQPVLATISPEKINQLAESLLAVIEGDGNGVGPALAAIGQLSSYVSDRQQVITTLVRNMSEAADKIGGRAPHLVDFIGNITDVFEALRTNLVGLIDFALTAPPVLDPADRLLATLGFTVWDNPDIDKMVRRLIPDPEQIVDILGRLPAVLAGIAAAVPTRDGSPAPVCSKGNAAVPSVLQVLIGGRKVKVCKG
jgi:phospholipid/cholesterol/gamma-HCH transport system substrate-binding protein